jgi:small subunit ribosomal protein S10
MQRRPAFEEQAMTQYARIKLTSSNLEELELLAREIKDITEKTGVKSKGPQPLPTKKLKITTRKAPTGEGTHTFDHWQLRIHRRILDIEPDDRTMKQITKLRIPEDVKIELTLTS